MRNAEGGWEGCCIYLSHNNLEGGNLERGLLFALAEDTRLKRKWDSSNLVCRKAFAPLPSISPTSKA